MTRLIKTTILGGILFLVPIVIFVAITRFDDSWQLVFEIERLADGKVVVFLPGSPDPWSGSVCVVSDDRVTPLDLTVNSAANLMKRLGRGATDTLQKAIAINQPLQ